MPPLAPAADRAVAARDDFLSRDRQEAVLKFLKAPGWAYGAYSDPAPEASRYWYKHFAGYVRDGRETRTPAEIEAELEGNAPVIAEVWRRLRDEVLPGHALTRCYANAYSFGAEGGLHYDSDVETHFTVIYYPLLAWSPNFGGETVFFNQTGDEIIASVYPKPNRLIWFPGVIPHAARGLSRTCRDLRITLMFKTAGPV